jgi:hypothetical protein
VRWNQLRVRWGQNKGRKGLPDEEDGRVLVKLVRLPSGVERDGPSEAKRKGQARSAWRVRKVMMELGDEPDSISKVDLSIDLVVPCRSVGVLREERWSFNIEARWEVKKRKDEPSKSAMKVLAPLFKAERGKLISIACTSRHALIEERRDLTIDNHLPIRRTCDLDPERIPSVPQQPTNG